MRKIFLLFILLVFSFSLSAEIVLNNEKIAPEPESEIFAKPEVLAKDYMAVTGHKLATEAAYKVLAKKGSAIDAAIAAQMVLNVVEPHASGIGGGGFLLYYDNRTKKSVYFDGRETAPKNINPNEFLNENNQPKEFLEAIKGGASVGVPGLLKMLNEAHKEYGKLPWFELFTDAIDIAVIGYKISERGNKVTEFAKHIREFPETKELYLQENNRPREVGDIVVNSELAEVFREIAAHGIYEFYHGRIAEDIVNAVNQTKVNPGSLTLEDMQNYQIEKGELICNKYRKYNVCSMPMPSSGGVTLLQALGILENFDLGQMDPDSKEAIHVISEAVRLSFADRDKYMADNKFVDVPISNLLDQAYLKQRSFLINVDAALLRVEAGDFSEIEASQKYSYYRKLYEPNSTTHISIVDSFGNAVSFTSSIEYAYGSGLMVDGFLLNNQLTDFSFVSEKDGRLVANRIEPGKRPRSSMTPVFVFNNKGKLVLVLGSPGGARIIPYVLKTIIAVLDWKFNVDEAIALPNFNKMFDVLEIEEGSYLTDLVEDLKTTGHEVVIRDLTSGVNAIQIDKKIMSAGVDTRREGVALGR